MSRPRTDEAFGWATGTVRAIIVGFLLLSCVVLQVLQRTVPDQLWTMTSMAIVFYFSKSRETTGNNNVNGKEA